QRVRPPQVSFTADERAYIDIEVERKKAGKFDVLLGILPPVNNTQRLQFTGSMDILLVSPLRFGEQIAFKYNKLVGSSQQVNFDLMVPYLFRIPLKLETHFDLLKQREDFLNLNASGSALFEFSPFLAGRFYVKNRSSRLLDSAFRDTSTMNFSQLDGNRRLFGLGLVYENLDYKLNPGKGWSAFVDVGVGRRMIRENFLLKNAFPEVYQDLNLRQPVNEINMEVNWYKTLFPRNVIHLANRTYWLGMENYLRNDQLQVGGSRSIRGFNENEFFTDFYSFFTAEYRFQLERDSYLFLFGDYAYLENNETGTIDYPMGVGFGMNYGTKAGIISLVYAIGRSKEIPFQPARGKIHIGFINQF
ncbi:MAG: BamA/TamA family outer membrane protein, partial [Bacteroidetes bacterium]|nr:BamA/TamA family outer membrane protein [Bacteroidota bacterium]